MMCSPAPAKTDRTAHTTVRLGIWHPTAGSSQPYAIMDVSDRLTSVGVATVHVEGESLPRKM